MELKKDFGNFTEVFLWRVERSTDLPALRYKKEGKWLDITWNQFKNEAIKIGKGLINLGIENGTKVNVFSGTVIEWPLIDIGILFSGGIVVPIYQSNTADESYYIIDNSEAEFLFVENNDLLNRLDPVREKMSRIKKIILMRGEPEKKDDMVITLDELKELGKDGKPEDFKDRGIAKKKEDPITIIYTSGTTGVPKGVVLTHDNILGEMITVIDTVLAKTKEQEKERLAEGDVSMMFLPLAHVFARAVHWIGIYVGLINAYAEGIPQLMDNIKEVRPHLMGSVPRIYEKVYAKITGDVEEAGGLKKKIFYWSLKMGSEVSRRIEAKQSIPPFLQFKFNIARKLVFNKLKEAFGGRLKFFLSSGAPLAKQIAQFFHSADIFIMEVWGMTELTGAATGNRFDNFKFGSVGLPYEGIEIKIAEDGELLVKGPIVMKEYFKMPEETAETLEGGWMHTGDIATMDKDGFIYITDRKKDLIITSGGKNIAPQKIENMIKTDRYLNQIVVVGNDRNYLTALITLDYEEVEKYAADKGIKYSSKDELADNPEIYNLIKSRIEEYNKNLASYETIKKFTILKGELSQEGGELTPTLKLKRRIIEEKYMDIIDGMYQG